MSASDIPNLTRDDAQARADLLRVESYDIALDLTDGGGKPGDRTFRSTTTVRFTTTRPGESTFIDVIADRFHCVTLNGVDLDVSNYRSADGLPLADLAAENVLVVDADLLYTNTGEGLHRFVDPLDGEVYLYSQFETADAKRVYTCFDQPDLKATFTIQVTVPDHWAVASNGALVEEEQLRAGKIVRFATTERMSPYITALVAGPYHVERDEHDGIELGLWCRRTMAPNMDAAAIFEITRQGFEWYHANFGVRYAFGKYDQLFVPEFNAGAMENAGCVTFHEDYLFRSKVTDARYERRAATILHEMAHMWFGDLVTMRWWDDLWLNESFAEYACVLAQTRATRWRDAWTTFANVEKTWAYRQDQLPSTHPIATDAPDVQTAEVNFDGITYAKGASVLKQLGSYVGVDAFLAGLRDYFERHAFGNTTLADLLSALERSSGRDLGEWSKLWLETSGINTIRADFEVDAEGRYTSFELVQSAPDDVARSNTLRPHRLAIGRYDDSGEKLDRIGRVEVDVTGARTAIPELVGVAQPPLLLINDDDLTYCKMRLDETSLRTLRTGGIERLIDPLPRALTWSAAWDMTRDGELATRDYVAMVVAGAHLETDIGVMQSLLRQANRAVEIYADPAWAPTGYQQLADASLAALRSAEPGSDHQLAWAHAFLNAARGEQHVELIADIHSGATVIAGLALDHDLRWAFVATLASRGRLDRAAIDLELERDPSAAGQRHAATAQALMPTADAKAETWDRIVHDDRLPNAMQRALISGFSDPAQGELLAPYVQRYFEDIIGVWDRRSSEVAQVVAVGLFPSWGAAIDAETISAADRLLAGGDIPSGLRRLVLEGRADVVRALRARDVDAAAS
ncbi:MAG TPA: aminopeptidase N [Jatrophihabitans sp.]